MKKIDLGQSITILANIGVVAGIAFLAVELQQNNELLRVEVELSRNDRIAESFYRFSESPELATVLAKYQRDEELTPGEQLQLHSLAHGILVSFSWVYSQTEAGRIDETSLARWGLIFNHYPLGGVALLADHWDASKDYFDPNFVEWMEETVVNR